MICIASQLADLYKIRAFTERCLRIDYNFNYNFMQWRVLKQGEICRFKLNVLMFFYQISRIFFCFLIISWYDFIIFLFYYHFCHEIWIRSIYSIKMYTEPISWIFWNIQRFQELFLTKKFLVSTHNIMFRVLCVGVMSELSKIWKFSAIENWQVRISKNVIFF